MGNANRKRLHARVHAGQARDSAKLDKGDIFRALALPNLEAVERLRSTLEDRRCTEATDVTPPDGSSRPNGLTETEGVSLAIKSAIEAI